MNYDDIIELEHPTSIRHPRMSLEARSAQFQPFAALTGYGDLVKEKARITCKKIILDDEAKKIINEKLNFINNVIKKNPKVSITHFIKDLKKKGGIYITTTDNIKKIDNVYKIIYLQNKKIRIEDILNINMKNEEDIV